MKLIITILLLTIGAFAQNTKYKDGTDCECDSISTSYYESGVLKVENPYVNEKLNGTRNFYYESGKLLDKSTWINGELYDGKTYYESGMLKALYTYYNTTLYTELYYKNGKLAGYHTSKNGKLVGYKKCTDGRVGNENLNCLK